MTDAKPRRRLTAAQKADRKVRRQQRQQLEFLPAHRGGSPAARARRKGMVCPRCQKDHVLASGKPSCNGHKKRVRPYQPCPRPPIKGGEVCVMHGAGSKVVKEKAARRLEFARIEGEVGKLLKECDLPDQHPIDGLLEVVRHSGAMMRLLYTLCATLKLIPDEVKIAFPDKGEPIKYTINDDTLYGYNHSGDQAQHILVIMYGIWADRYMRACKVALDANIDERLVRNAESTTNAVFVAVERAIDKAGLTPAQAAAFATTLADELRKLAGPIEERRQVNASKR